MLVLMLVLVLVLEEGMDRVVYRVRVRREDVLGRDIFVDGFFGSMRSLDLLLKSEGVR